MNKSQKNTAEKSALRILWGNLRRVDRSAPDKDKIKFLKRIPFFEGLKKHQLQQVAQIVFQRTYQENEYLFEAGQPGAALFIVESGEISVEINKPEGEVVQLATLGKHAFVGELALLDETPRSASARATTPSHVMAFFKADLDQLMKTEPEIAAQVYKSLATIVGQRLKATNELIDKRLKSVA